VRSNARNLPSCENASENGPIAFELLTTSRAGPPPTGSATTEGGPVPNPVYRSPMTCRPSGVNFGSRSPQSVPGIRHGSPPLTCASQNPRHGPPLSWRFESNATSAPLGENVGFAS
jgi:hypothetical protein